jgi:hypothetical protein
MANTPQQQTRRRRVEAGIAVAAPVLDLMLAAGERVSRIVAPEEDEHPAIRPPGEKLELGTMRLPRREPTVE